VAQDLSEQGAGIATLVSPRALSSSRYASRPPSEVIPAPWNSSLIRGSKVGLRASRRVRPVAHPNYLTALAKSGEDVITLSTHPGNPGSNDNDFPDPEPLPEIQRPLDARELREPAAVSEALRLEPMRRERNGMR
jgi:hypothetical protein